MDLTTRVHQSRHTPPGSAQLSENLHFPRQVPVTKTDIELAVSEARLVKAVEWEAVFRTLVVEHIIKKKIWSGDGTVGSRPRICSPSAPKPMMPIFFTWSLRNRDT
jgi:hypothetical protein